MFRNFKRVQIGFKHGVQIWGTNSTNMVTKLGVQEEGPRRS